MQKIVPDYGNEIGALMLMYIDRPETTLKQIAEELMLHFNGRLKEVCSAVSYCYAIDKYKGIIYNEYSLQPGKKTLDQLKKKNFVFPDKTLSQVNFINFLKQTHKTETEKKLKIDEVRTTALLLDFCIPGIDITDTWIQDFFLCTQDTTANWQILSNPLEDISRLLTNHLISNPPNNRMITTAKPAQLSQLKGGNMVCGDDFVITNLDLLLYNIENFPTYSIEIITEKIKADLNVSQVIWADDYIVSGYTLSDQLRDLHIDMLVTLGPKTDNGQYVLVAELKKEYYTRFATFFQAKKAKRLQWNMIQHHLNCIAAKLDSIKDGRGNKKFIIKRIPATITFEEAIGQDPDETFPKWRIRTYNNCITEEEGGNKIIYLPVYDGSFHNEQRELNHTRIKNELEAVLAECGFNEIKYINAPKAFESLMTDGGSLRCVTKVLYRNP